jgi:hypothetical protein
VPTLVDAAETEIGTDFALLQAEQGGAEYLNAGSFARSAPGVVKLTCGNKYSHVRIRAERWDERPPLTDEWEDLDDLPFESIPSAGNLMLSGFDPGEVGLDLGDLGRGRVQVLARGRHRYRYNTEPLEDGMPPEEWLLRLYPSEEPIDPLKGGPRRIAGDEPLSISSRSPWRAAVRGFRSSGWAHALSGSHAFYIAELALLVATAPLTREELAAGMARWMPPWQVGGPGSESIEIPPRPSSRGDVDALGMRSGHGEITSIGDAIDALMAIGLLLVEDREDVRLLIPNPCPIPAWEHGGATGADLMWMRSRSLREEYDEIANDIASAVSWLSTGGLVATPRAMAIRWSTTPETVVGGLRVLGGEGRVRSDRPLGFDVELEFDQPLTLWRGPRWTPE